MKKSYLLFVNILILTQTILPIKIIGSNPSTPLHNWWIDVQLTREFPTLSININDNADLSTFHFYSHGRPGQLLIDGKWLNQNELAVYFSKMIAMKGIKHLNIYGCEFAKGEKGLAALKFLEKELGLSISASTNITGEDGDWILELGETNKLIALENFKGNLQNCIPSTISPNTATLTDPTYSADIIANTIDNNLGTFILNTSFSFGNYDLITYGFTSVKDISAFSIYNNAGANLADPQAISTIQKIEFFAADGVTVLHTINNVSVPNGSAGNPYTVTLPTTLIGVKSIKWTNTAGLSSGMAFRDFTLSGCTSVDADGDGYPDSVDLDDDNDGILDTAEGLCTTSTINNLGGTSTYVDSDAYNSPNGSLLIDGNLGTYLLTSDNSGMDQLTFNLGSTLTNVSNVYIYNNAGMFLGDDQALSGIGTLKLYDISGNLIGTHTNISIPNGDSGGNPYVYNFGTTYANVKTMVWENITVLNSGFALREVKLDGCIPTDTDLDGIPNYLDLDSDGDGCTDAIEGGAAFTSSALYDSALPGGNSGSNYRGSTSIEVTQNLGNDVDAYGVPKNATSSGQSIGSSQDVNIQDINCLSLPVKLLTFDVYNIDCKVNMLNWVTTTEVNSELFEIERSVNGNNFETIGYVEAAHNSTTNRAYLFNEYTSQSAYYRLKMVNTDKSFEYSEIIFLNPCVDKVFKIGAISPNPAAEIVNLELKAEYPREVTVSIFNALGQLVLSLPKQKLNIGYNNILINVDELPNSTYFLRVDANNIPFFMTNFIKVQK